MNLFKRNAMLLFVPYFCLALVTIQLSSCKKAEEALNITDNVKFGTISQTVALGAKAPSSNVYSYTWYIGTPSTTNTNIFSLTFKSRPSAGTRTISALDTTAGVGTIYYDKNVYALSGGSVTISETDSKLKYVFTDVPFNFIYANTGAGTVIPNGTFSATVTEKW